MHLEDPGKLYLVRGDDPPLPQPQWFSGNPDSTPSPPPNQHRSPWWPSFQQQRPESTFFPSLSRKPNTFPKGKHSKENMAASRLRTFPRKVEKTSRFPRPVLYVIQV